MIAAKIILDSISAEGHRLTTFQLRYPRFIHDEVMTHRVFSRNASSSRAVPIARRIEEASDPALRAEPVSWGENRPGMQAGPPLNKLSEARARGLWERAANEAAATARMMVSGTNVHKQVVNRILEPFTHIDVLVTATEFMNFFGLRLDAEADPTLQAVAEAMWFEYERSQPKVLSSGEWHLPYVNTDEAQTTSAIQISVARCARLSYMSFDTGRPSTLEADLELYKKLLGSQPLHASPAEHQATPDDHHKNPFAPNSDKDAAPGYSPMCFNLWNNPEEHGNFAGWRQYRKMIKGEDIAPLPKGYIR